MNPWLREIPWHTKLKRVLHCFFSMFGEAVFLDYISEDIEYWMKKLEAKQ